VGRIMGLRKNSLFHSFKAASWAHLSCIKMKGQFRYGSHFYYDLIILAFLSSAPHSVHYGYCRHLGTQAIYGLEAHE
jgi:hypothetical protein